MSGLEIMIEPAVGLWSVRAQGAVIGETQNAMIVHEADLAPVVYIPRDDLQMLFFDPSETTTTCPHKGVATYYHLVGKNRRQKDVAWSYETPKHAASAIAGYLAFDADAVTVEIAG